jgi:hypothetical protein
MDRSRRIQGSNSKMLMQYWNWWFWLWVEMIGKFPFVLNIERSRAETVALNCRFGWSKEVRMMHDTSIRVLPRGPYTHTNPHSLYYYWIKKQRDLFCGYHAIKCQMKMKWSISIGPQSHFNYEYFHSNQLSIINMGKNGMLETGLGSIL